MRDSVTFFYSPSEVTEETAPAGRMIRLGGLVLPGSVDHGADGSVAFAVTDNAADARIVFQGDLPDLFREGQGIVAQGAFDEARVFRRHAGAGQARRDLHAARGGRPPQGNRRVARRR